MEEELEAPWWQTVLRGLGIFLGLLAMAGLLMGIIIGVARFLDQGERPAISYSAPAASGDPVPQEQNARTRTPSAYEPVPWPTYPGRGPGFGGGSRMAASSASSAGSVPEQSKPSVPVGISTEEYQAAAAAGKKLYLPDPKGECDLSGSNDTSQRALETCFAARAAR